MVDVKHLISVFSLMKVRTFFACQKFAHLTTEVFMHQGIYNVGNGGMSERVLICIVINL
jgi:hypothetical protein